MGGGHDYANSGPRQRRQPLEPGHLRFFGRESILAKRLSTKLKEAQLGLFLLPFLAGAGGFEPPTTGFGDQRSDQTELRSYALNNVGTPGGIRTPDARLRTPPLYPLSYRGIWWR